MCLHLPRPLPLPPPLHLPLPVPLPLAFTSASTSASTFTSTSTSTSTSLYLHLHLDTAPTSTCTCTSASAFCPTQLHSPLLCSTLPALPCPSLLYHTLRYPTYPPLPDPTPPTLILLHSLRYSPLLCPALGHSRPPCPDLICPAVVRSHVSHHSLLCPPPSRPTILYSTCSLIYSGQPHTTHLRLPVANLTLLCSSILHSTLPLSYVLYSISFTRLCATPTHTTTRASARTRSLSLRIPRCLNSCLHMHIFCSTLQPFCHIYFQRINLYFSDLL